MKNQEIDLIVLGKKIFSERRIIYKYIIIFTFIGIIIAFSIPQKYKVDVILSPESGQTSGSSSNLAGMASMLGLGGIGGSNQDAVNSSMFPELIKSTPFILEMYNVEVTPQNSQKHLTLSEYVVKQKTPWWNHILKLPNIIISALKSFFSEKETNSIDNSTLNPFRLTGEQNGKITAIKQALSASIDNKSGMTTVSVILQDPDIAATIADTTVAKLQKFIIDYRIRKALEDCYYLEKLCEERKKEYYQAQQAYANFMDANRNVVLQRTQAEGTRLQNDLSIAFQIYSQVETQLQVARAKVQEAKPVFAIVEPATIPLHASSPNKTLIIAGCILLSIICSSAWILLIKK